MSPLIERRRPREEPHQRSIQEQTLDALLRIEELLIAQAKRHTHAPDQLVSVGSPAGAGTAPAKPKGRK